MTNETVGPTYNFRQAFYCLQSPWNRHLFFLRGIFLYRWLTGQFDESFREGAMVDLCILYEKALVHDPLDTLECCVLTQSQRRGLAPILLISHQNTVVCKWIITRDVHVRTAMPACIRLSHVMSWLVYRNISLIFQVASITLTPLRVLPGFFFLINWTFYHKLWIISLG